VSIADNAAERKICRNIEKHTRTNFNSS
jgi:hypothetical protein